MVNNVGWVRFGFFRGRFGVVRKSEFRVFVRVLMKLWCMDQKKREWDPCWRALKALVFLLEID